MAGYDNNILEQIPKITTATIEIFNFLVNNFPPTPSKIYYKLTLRDISRVFEGLCSTAQETMLQSNYLIRVWRNEIHCAFFDRLNSKEERDLAESKLSDHIKVYFTTESNFALANPMVFGNFSQAVRRITEGIDDSRLYRDLGNFADMRKPLNQVMESYNASHQKEPLKLVLLTQPFNI